MNSPLTITSQFAHCSLPLRLDAYRGCSFSCNYCFARVRGGNSPSQRIVPAKPSYLAGIFDRIDQGEVLGTLRQFLSRGVPIHFGGMSDPFQQRERKDGVSLAFMQELQRRNYPTVISTKSAMVAETPYRELLASGWSVVVQFSLTSTEDDRSFKLEPFADPPSETLAAMARLALLGVRVSARWQPYIEALAEPPEVYVRRVAEAGAFHLSLEHLKVSLEEKGWVSTRSGISMPSLKRQYQSRGALRDGREYVLPSTQKLPTILKIRNLVHRYGMTFGAADNDFQFLSDGEACCSGVDRWPQFSRVFKHHIALAVKRGAKKGIVQFNDIVDEWCPETSIDRYLNSRSRIGNRSMASGSIRDHISARWENMASSSNPIRYFGVTDSGGRDNGGHRVFRMNFGASMGQ
jgi:DNA repair photolyase